MKSYKEFFTTRNGNGYNSIPATYKKQCVALFHEYFRYIFEFQPPATPSAWNIWTDRDKVFAGLGSKVSFIEDISQLKIGDVCVYKANIPGMTFDNGHVDIYGGDGNYFGQNFACNKLDVKGFPECPASLSKHNNLKPTWIIRFNEIEENGVQQQTDTPQPIEVPQSTPSLQRRNFKPLEGIRGRTAPNFDNNIYTQFNGIGKSINQLEIVDGAEYQGSNKWVKFRYADLQLDNRADIDIYSHSSFFE